MASGARKPPNVIVMLHLFEHVPRCSCGDSQLAGESLCTAFPDSCSRIGLRANVDEGEPFTDRHAPISNVLPNTAPQLQETIFLAHRCTPRSKRGKPVTRGR